MAILILLTAKTQQDFHIQVDEPLRPYALAYLAASGLFDMIGLAERAGSVPPATIKGADLIRCADQVKPVIPLE